MYKPSHTATSLTEMSKPANFWCLLHTHCSYSEFAHCPNKGFVGVDEILLPLLWDNTVSEQTGCLLQKEGGIRHVKLQLITATALSQAKPKLWSVPGNQSGGTAVFSRSETTMTNVALLSVEGQNRSP